MTEPVLDQDDNKQSRCCNNLQKICSTHPCLYCFMFASIVTLDLAETTNDWLLYSDISRIEKGLIYGPLDPYLVLIFLIICSVSAVAFCFEILNLLRDLCTGRPLLDLDLVSALNVWLCDVSMMTINIVIALCHSEPISYFQLTKAILIIIGVVLRITVPLARIYVKHNRKAEKFRKSIYRVSTTIGVCLMLVGAATLFIFTHVITSDEGKPQFLLPKQIWEGKITYKRYFAGFGIYFTYNGLRFANLSPKEQYWIKLASIKEFYNEESINIKMSAQVHGQTIQKLIVNSYNTTGQRFKECYSIEKDDKNAMMLNLVENCSSDFIANSQDIVFRFIYVHPRIHLVLGDIIYNAKYRKGSLCYNLTANDTNIYNTDKENPIGQLLYMKHDTQASEGHRLVQHNSSSQDIINGDIPQYETQHYLLEAYKVWKMGMYGCEVTGRRGPTKNESVTLSC